MADYGVGILIQWSGMVFMYTVAADVTYRGWEQLSVGTLSMLFLHAKSPRMTADLAQ
jgi:hypothetical protein